MVWQVNFYPECWWFDPLLLLVYNWCCVLEQDPSPTKYEYSVRVTVGGADDADWHICQSTPRAAVATTVASIHLHLL